MKKLFLIISFFLAGFYAFSQIRIAPVKSSEQILNEEYCSGLFSTPDATYFDMLDNSNNASAMSYINILDWLQGRVAGLQIYKTSTYTSIPYIRNQRAAIYVDEIPISEDFMNIISAADIAMIKIIKNPFIAGWRGAGGVIAIYTIRGEDEGDE